MTLYTHALSPVFTECGYIDYVLFSANTKARAYRQVHDRGLPGPRVLPDGASSQPGQPGAHQAHRRS